MTVIRHTETRRTETPGGVMTTLASPTQGEAGLALWRVEVGPGASGPRHAIDADQIWTVVHGRITVDLDDTELTAAEGDTVVLHADRWRQISGGDSGFTAIVAAPAGAMARTPGGAEPVLPPWIA
ncbi:cupin domain-containing protein [Nocardia arizonensis]|uniref:cupin domain-containing protein n=1 Tax=Nocardia arizonensis TaxID=1141647 RepID=UPI0006D11065|nr:cupin domain-containing protein [Nocardia arizonensis]